MKGWLVDTSVLLDVIGADATFGEPSRRALARCLEDGFLVVNPVIIAEVSALLASLEEVDRLLPKQLLRRDSIPWEAVFLAGQAYASYKERGGSKPRMLADFLIGVHAAVAGFGLISCDEGYRRTFRLELLNPIS